MESAMASGKRSLNARTQARNARGQFASVKTEVGAAPKQIILVYSSSDSEGAPGPTEKVATSDAGERKLVGSVATRTRAAAAGKKGASGAPPLTGKRGSVSVNKTTKGATSASKKKQAPATKAIAGGGSGSKQKKESASKTKSIAMGASGSKQKNKVLPFLLPPSVKCVMKTSVHTCVMKRNKCTLIQPVSLLQVTFFLYYYYYYFYMTQALVS